MGAIAWSALHDEFNVEEIDRMKFARFRALNPLAARFAMALFAALLSACAATRLQVAPDAAMSGTWIPVKAELGGKEFKFVPDFKLEVKGDRFKTYGGTKSDAGRLEFFDGTSRGVDVIGEDDKTKGQRLPAIYRFSGSNEMEITYDLSGKERPAEFASKPGTQLFRIIYKRGG
jgi:uncharacterized protein (TIGR03067 family)